MMPYCANGTSCPYRTDTGHCRYIGYGCIEERFSEADIVMVKIPDKPKYSITQLVDLSDESIEKIANAVIKKLYQIKEGRWIENEGRSGWHCSCCGKDDLYAYLYAENNKLRLQDFYCPNCGAKMYEEETE